jgi:hypothetical protein
MEYPPLSWFELNTDGFALGNPSVDGGGISAKILKRYNERFFTNNRS